MKFARITENKAYEYVAEATRRLHEKGVECREIAEHPAVLELELNYSMCTTSGYGLTGEGEYSSVFVTGKENGYMVYDIYIDTLSPDDTVIKEISEKLGKLNPEHARCDIRNPISMAILHYLELFCELPKKYEVYANKG
ncbi:hypothetical protein TDB9533_04811 [Thalassocella blandensis]|nr:hypothetical protein TDB9533_04811 [Thalassocella blandensis]